MPKVSICIPAYNKTEKLTKLMESIKIQIYKDYEIVITDDSSDNENGKMLKTYNELPVKYIKNETNLGPSKNWNQSIKQAKGQYIKMMFDDDWFSDENSLGKFVSMLDENPEIDIAFSGTHQVFAEKSYSRYIAEKDAKRIKQDWKNLFLGNVVGAPSAVIFRNKEYLFDESLKWVVDVELYMSILKEHPKFVYTKEPLVSIGMDDDQLTNSCQYNLMLIYTEHKHVYQKYHLKDIALCEKQLVNLMIRVGFGADELKSLKASKLRYVYLKTKRRILELLLPHK
jgi:glycosyltransferase involved in cell wall biosynthesis